MKILAALVVIAGGALAADAGLPPRAAAARYAAHIEKESFEIGADLLTPDQVRGAFVTDLNRGYVVVEVGVFPRGEMEITPMDFTLREAGTDRASRPVNPKTVAGVLQKTAPRQRDVDLYPAVGIGYETGGGYDPVTGRRGGWTAATGVGVGVGNTRPASTDADRKTMAMELADKELPEGKTARPVAGYVYFPVPSKRKDMTYNLEYNLGGNTVTLPLARGK